MASINNATKEIVCKVVYYGPGMSGKTTNLQVIHKNLPENNRGQLVSLDTQQERTLFFDFLPIDLGTIEGYATKFQLYTVPGQTYYNATRKLVLRGVDAIVFVCDSQMGKMDENIESWTNLHENMTEYGYKLDDIPHVLQYNKQDVMGSLSVRDMDATMNPEGKIPSLGAVAYEGKGVKDTLKIVASGVLDKLRHQLASLAAAQSAPGALAAASMANGASAYGTTGGNTATMEAPPELRARASRDNTPVPAGPKKRLIDPAMLNKIRPMLTRRAAAPPPPKWELEQHVDVHWRGMKVGRGVVRIEPRQNLDREGSYLVVAEYRTWGLFRRSVSGPAQPQNEQRHGHGAVLPLSGPHGYGPEALIEPGASPVVWMRVGALRLVPAGRRLSAWPDDARLMPPLSDVAPIEIEEVRDHVPTGA